MYSKALAKLLSLDPALSACARTAKADHLIFNLHETIPANIDHLCNLNRIANVTAAFKFFPGTFSQYLSPIEQKHDATSAYACNNAETPPTTRLQAQYWSP